MPSLPPQIFHSYDIRGKYNEELTDHIALLLGKALGTYILCNTRTQSEPTICVGHDKRPSGEILKKEFIKGVMATGCNIIDLGVVTTPMVNFYEYTSGVAAEVSITASHIEDHYNGFKIGFNRKPFGEIDYQELRKIADIGKFEKGEGHLEKKNITEEYLQNIYSKVDVKRDKVKRISQSLKLSQDPDGDRLIVKGVDSDLLNAIFAASILEKSPYTKIVLSVASSPSIIDYIEKHGGKVLLSKVGYPNILTLMNQTGAIFGGEVSGHFYFKDRHFGYSDGLYSAARLSEILSEKDVTLAQLVKQIPQRPTTELHAKVPTGKNPKSVAFELIKDMHLKFKDANFLEIDGARISFPDKSWLLVRASGTENIISFRAEAKTDKRLLQLIRYTKKAFTKHELKLE